MHALLLSAVLGVVTVGPDAIITDHETIPRFETTREIEPGEVASINLPTSEPVIEVFGELVVSSELLTNTITVMPGGTLVLTPGAVVVFSGPIPDQDGGQFGRGLINLGWVEAIGVEIQPWASVGGEYLPNLEPRSIQLVGADRAHFMTTGDGNHDVRYASFSRMDRTATSLLAPVANQKGRYAVHWHHSTTPGGVVHGCLFTDFLKWPLTIHDTRGHWVTDNVFVGDGPGGLSQGAAVVTEQGNETDCVIAGNLAIGVWGPPPENRPIGDNGFEGAGLWLAGTVNCVIEDNVAIDCRHGFVDFTNGRAGQTILDSDGVVIPKNRYVPASWARNVAIDCDRGMDVYGASFLDRFDYVDQEFIGCNWGVSLRTFHHYFTNPLVLDCNSGFVDFGYVGRITTEGGRIENCGVGSNLNETFFLDTELIGNDWDVQVTSNFGGQAYIRSQTMPRVQRTFFGNNTEASATIADAYFQIELPDKRYLIFDHSMMPDAVFPNKTRNVLEGGVFFADPLTNQQTWDRFSLWAGSYPVLADTVVTNHTNIRDNQNVLLPLIELDAPPVRPVLEPQCFLHRAFANINWVSYTLAGHEHADAVRCYVNGEARASQLVQRDFRGQLAYRGIFTVFGIQPTDEISMELVRGGQVIATDVLGEEDGGATLEELLALLAELEAELAGLQGDLAALENELAIIDQQIDAVFAELLDELSQPAVDWLAVRQLLTLWLALLDERDLVVAEIAATEIAIAEVEQQIADVEEEIEKLL